MAVAAEILEEGGADLVRGRHVSTVRRPRLLWLGPERRFPWGWQMVLRAGEIYGGERHRASAAGLEEVGPAALARSLYYGPISGLD